MAIEFPQIENRNSFENRLESFSELDKEFLRKAYDRSKVSHSSQLRQGGGKYFDHPRHVAIILMDDCKVRESQILAGALLHDVMEDTQMFGSARNSTYQDWVETARERITQDFSLKVAETKEHYFPIFKKIERAYPDEYKYLISEMETAIAALNL